MEFKNFIENYRKLKQSEKTLLNKNKSRYYEQIRTILKKSNLFKRINSTTYESKEKISYNYDRISKIIRPKPYNTEKFCIQLGDHERVPDYDVFGKRIGS